jgi:lipopolysaccharide heptosyltransferase I
MEDRLKILIVRLSAIGDVVHSLPILHSLRRKFPDAYIAWAVEDKAAQILINNPLLDHVYVLNKQKWKSYGLTFKTIKEIFSLIRSIRAEKFDIAIDLQELFKSAFVTFLSSAKRRIAHDKTREFAQLFANEKLPYHDIFDPDKMIIERYLEPAQYLGAPVDEVKFSLPPLKEETKAYVDELLKDIDKTKPVIIFAPATIWPTKHWLESYWAELLDMMAENNNIIFIGTWQNNALINKITSLAKTDKFLSLVGKTALFDLIELFNRSDIVIAPDTGPMHIANATDKPVIISMFGSTSYKRSAPYGEKHVALSATLPCQPCFKRQCPKEAKMECMKKITPDMIFQIVNQKLNFRANFQSSLKNHGLS